MLEKIRLPARPSLRGNDRVADASHCQGCSSQFTFINRKHHCRRCGGLFCGNCTRQRMVLRGQSDSSVRIVKAANQQDSNSSMQTETAPYNPYKAANLQSMQQVTQRKGQLNYAEEEEDNPPTIKRKDHVLKAASPNAPAADPPLPYA